jgi:hypothetical protein
MLGVRILNTRIRSGSAHPDLSEPGANHVFPYQITFPQNNSAQNCLTQCSTFGYPAAGMENGTECCVWFTPMERLRLAYGTITLTRVRRCGRYHQQRRNDRPRNRLHHGMLGRLLSSLWRLPEATTLPLERRPEQLADPCQYRPI